MVSLFLGNQLLYPSFTISPNPTSDFVTIKTSENEEIASLFLTSLDGKVVNEFKAINASNFLMDLNTFSPGIYFLTVITKAGRVEISKLIKL